MRIMVLGAGGFIGRHILSELLQAGHSVLGIVRDTTELAASFPTVEFIQMDLATATDEQDWQQWLKGVDCIVNAAGVLRGRHMDAIHVDMPKALHRAAKRANVEQVLLLSAISARADVATDYSRSKLAGEDALRMSGLNWTILRPSLVYGDGSYGGTSLMRGIAGLPFLTPLPGNGAYLFTPIHVEDLARSVALACGNSQYYGRQLEPVGPDTLSLKALLDRYRRWLGFGAPHFLSIPIPLIQLMGSLGDIAGSGPIATNSLAQLVAGNSGDSRDFAKAIGFAPRSLDTALLTRPAQVQDRWHARLFFLAPAIKAVLIFLWVASAYLGLFHGQAATQSLISGLGLPQGAADPLRIAGASLDIGIAFLLFFDSKARWSTAAQLAVVAGYTVMIGLALPQLWADPFGPLLKNIPILLLIAVHGAIGSKR